MRNSKVKGFTLIELIVVIAIIAILAAVLIPRFTGFSASAKQKAAISDARNYLVAVEALLAEGDTTITLAEITNFTGKPFKGVLSTEDGTEVADSGSLDSATFWYTLDGCRVFVDDGEIDTEFEEVDSLVFTTATGSHYVG